MIKKAGSEKFCQWLVNQQPVYDRMILEDIEPGLCILDRDLRFVSGSSKAVLKLRRKSVSLSAIARMFHWSRYKVNKVCDKAQADVKLKLKAWISGLSKSRQTKERSLRSGWVGHVGTGLFPVSDVPARFDAVYPDLKPSWPK